MLVMIMTLIDLISVIYYKLSVNGMNLLKFDILYVGNLITIFIYGLIFAGLLIKLLRNGSEKSHYRILFLLSLLSFGILILVVLIGNLGLLSSDEYMLGFPAIRLVVTVLLLIKLFLSFYLATFIWSSVIKSDNWNILRSMISAFIACVILFVFAFLYSKKEFRYKVEEGRKYETAVVLGAAVWKKDQPTPLFAARIKKAYELYNEFVVSKILVTGSNAPGELSEAESAQKLLHELGVKSQDIIIENDSRTTIEQLNYLKYEYLPKINTKEVVIITDRFHLARSTEICKFLKIEHLGIASNYDVSLHKLLFYKIKETIALLVFWLYGM